MQQTFTKKIYKYIQLEDQSPEPRVQTIYFTCFSKYVESRTGVNTRTLRDLVLGPVLQGRMPPTTAESSYEGSFLYRKVQKILKKCKERHFSSKIVSGKLLELKWTLQDLRPARKVYFYPFIVLRLELVDAGPTWCFNLHQEGRKDQAGMESEVSRKQTGSYW